MDIHSILSNIRGMTVSQLESLKDGITNLMASKVPIEEFGIEPTYPKLQIPFSLLLPSFEKCLIVFLQVQFDKFCKDYRVRTPGEVENDNSVIITSWFNEARDEKGQYPRIVVKTDGARLDPHAVGHYNDKFNAFPEKQQRLVMMRVPLKIYVITQNHNESNILAGHVLQFIGTNLEVIRNAFGIQKIDLPEMTGTQKVRDYSNVFTSVVSTTLTLNISWSDIYTMPCDDLQYILYRIVGHASGEDKHYPVGYLIGDTENIPPILLNRINELIKETP